ncbi:MAG: S10 family peptidase [Phenylobacterium sp.]|uniref:S10 family peptidase n=1 Tax=Phenylobacterium sp. TaxID=1871053 RepID=UPI00391B278D
MPQITKRTLLAAGLLAAAGGAKAQDLAGGPFVTRHSGVFNGRRVDYAASVGETLIPSPGGAPAARFVSTSYVARGASAKRPVLFAFNGGPSSSSQYLHMMALGPRRIAAPQDPAAPIGDLPTVDNAAAVLDVADLVLIDPAETGFSRILPGGRREGFYSVEGDARSVSDFVLAWLKANGREASPKYVLGESYGTLRAALMAGQLAAVSPLDGVFLFGQAVNMIETSQRAKNVLAYATNLPALAAIAAYHGRADTGKPMGAFIDETYAWGMGEYLQALVQGHDLPRSERERIAARLQAYTGIAAAYYLANDLVITKIAFARELLKDQGLILGTYDARYVGPAPPPGARPADPYGKVVEAVRPAMLAHLSGFLKVPWPAEAYRTSAPDTQSWNWNGTLGPGGPFLDYDYQARVGPAFQANPDFRLMIGTGIYDLTTTVGPARYLVSKSDWPRERVIQRQYVGGHMAYTHEPSLRAFTDDIRAFVTGKPLADGGNA